MPRVYIFICCCLMVKYNKVDVLQMMFGVPKEKQQEATEYIAAIQAGLRKVQGAIDLK